MPGTREERAVLGRSMLRYYAISAAIVILIGAAVFAHRIVMRNFNVHSDVAVPPHAQATAPPVPRGSPTFAADAPWAPAALPGCFDQLSSREGPVAAVTPLPAAWRVAPGSVVHAGDCVILVESRDLWVERGPDRLRVPPRAALFREPDGTLATMYEHGGRREVRRYAIRR